MLKRILALVFILVFLLTFCPNALAFTHYENIIAEGLIDTYDSGRKLQLDAAADWNASLATILSLSSALIPRNFELNMEGTSRFVTYTGVYPESMSDAQLQSAAESVLQNLLTPSMTDREKVIAIHDWIILHTTYGEQGIESHSPVGVFLNQTAVCDGYSRAMLLFCRLAQIPCLFLSSDAMNHSYNAVWIDGEWLLVDVTWDDPDFGSQIEDRYLLKRPAELPTHKVDGGVTMQELFDFGRTYYTNLIDSQPGTGADQLMMADLLHDKGLFLGTDLGYELDRAPTRAEAAVLFVRVLDRESEALAGENHSPFTDLPAWAAPHISLLYRDGLTKGQSETLFGSSAATSGRDFATFLLRALGYRDGQDFEWATAMDTAQTMGFAPAAWDGSSFTRGDAVEMMARALGFVERLS
ncbi:MAG: hypothetical protein IJG56_00075 [Clostridia bacterium]|nr:hypothetical protein [Clostridia bacterium]MBQ6001084.1 hypothetical protein [Clostridia bacterium]